MHGAGDKDPPPPDSLGKQGGSEALSQQGILERSLHSYIQLPCGERH